MVPRPGSLEILTWPPDCLTKPYTIDSPSPVPLPSGLVEKNGSNACSSTSGAMPEPVSVTATITYWPGATSCRRAYSSSSVALPASSVSRPPDWPWPSMASRALIARLSSAFSICAGSISVFLITATT